MFIPEACVDQLLQCICCCDNKRRARTFFPEATATGVHPWLHACACGMSRIWQQWNEKVLEGKLGH